jgi:hypothetical protein
VKEVGLMTERAYTKFTEEITKRVITSKYMSLLQENPAENIQL